MELSFQPQPHKEAIALINAKPTVTREVFDQLLPELRARVFTITGVEGAHVLQRIRDTIASLAEGGQGNTWDELKQEIVSDLATYLGDGAEQRATVLMRTHGFQAFQAANWRVAQEDEDTTHLQYLATEDDRVRDSHLALNGVILPKSDPFWDSHLPPWDWGCRCRVRPMNPDLVDDARADDRTRNPEDQLVIEGPALQQLRNGTLMRQGQRVDVTPPKDKPADGTPFQWHPDDLKLPVSELRKRYDETTWNAFETWSKATAIDPSRTVWEWLNETSPRRRSRSPRPAAPPAPARTPTPADYLADTLKTAGFSPTVRRAAAALPETIARLAETAQFIPQRGGAFYRRSDRGIRLQKDPKSWSGHPTTFRHELGHHVHYETNIITDSQIRPDFEQAMKTDFERWKSAVEKKLGPSWAKSWTNGNPFSVLEQSAETLGLQPGFEKDLDQKKRASRFADTVMGLSKGVYGAGHSYLYMLRNGPMEVFAHVFSAILENDVEFLAAFPDTVAIVRKEFGL